MNLHKHFKPTSALLEQLPNELFMEMFAYLTDVDVVYSFSQLNTRFQSLIRNYCHIFDFKSITKSKIDFIIQQHNPKYWQSLRLSNDDETPGQIETFSRLYPLDQHPFQLKSISLINVQPDKSNVIFSQIRSFVHLVSLTIKSVCGKCLSPMNLPSLKHLVVSSCIYDDWMMVRKRRHVFVIVIFSNRIFHVLKLSNIPLKTIHIMIYRKWHLVKLI
jgi:hypothetical protein